MESFSLCWRCTTLNAFAQTRANILVTLATCQTFHGTTNRLCPQRLGYGGVYNATITRRGHGRERTRMATLPPKPTRSGSIPIRLPTRTWQTHCPDRHFRMCSRDKCPHQVSSPTKNLQYIFPRLYAIVGYILAEMSAPHQVSFSSLQPAARGCVGVGSLV